MYPEIVQKVNSFLNVPEQPVDLEKAIKVIDTKQRETGMLYASTVKLIASVEQAKELFLTTKENQNFTPEDNLRITESQKKITRYNHLKTILEIQLNKTTTLLYYYGDTENRKSETVVKMRELLKQEAIERKNMRMDDMKADELIRRAKKIMEAERQSYSFASSHISQIPKEYEELQHLDIDGLIPTISEDKLLSLQILSVYALDIILILQERMLLQQKRQK